MSTFVSNTPYIQLPHKSTCRKADQPTPNTSTAPFDLLGFQCGGTGGACTTVNQWTYNPETALYYSSAQCSEVCGSKSPGLYQPGKVFSQ